MADTFFDRVYKNRATHVPDVLSCLANLSNDEVFTPPEVVNQMLDMLPQELFSDPNTTFLDPACKTGVFLREIAKRLLSGLEDKIPNLQERIDHIFHHQLFGIGITELTSLLARRSLYCSKYPNGQYSVTHFDDAEGNIRFRRIEHTWDKNNKCVFCGASTTLKRDSAKESHAYEWIHVKPERIFNMKFDVIISNPPYQLDVGISKDKYALPIYQMFVSQAIKLNPRYISMIIPARWYSGGRRLDDFRSEMLNCGHIKSIVDFPNPYDCFQGVDNPGGICYFLWQSDYNGDCDFTTRVGDGSHTIKRKLNEYPVFIRDALGLEIIKKIKGLNINNGRVLSDVVSPQTPFGIVTSYEPKSNGVPCWFTIRAGKQFAYESDIKDSYGLLNKYKLLIPKAPIAGQTDFTKPVGLYHTGNTIIADKGDCCTQTWLVAFSSESKKEVEYFQTYLLTKVVRFLILQTVVSQDVSREKYMFVPDLGKYDREYTDDYLREQWNITDEEWAYIDSRIHNYGAGGDE